MKRIIGKFSGKWAVISGLRAFGVFPLLALLFWAGNSRNACAQAVPTATAGVGISTFAGLSGVYTGVGLGRDLSVTAGLDLGFRPFFGLYPTAEIRGTYPIDRGSVDGEKNFLAGLVVSRHLGRLQPYGNILAGRGEIQFNNPYPNPSNTILYAQTASGVISPGGGCNVYFSDRLGFKGDFQFEKYVSPVTTSGNVFAKVFTVGVVYRPSFGGLGHGRR